MVMCDEDNTVWSSPTDIGSDRLLQPSAPDFSLPGGDTIKFGAWRWATRDEVTSAGWLPFLQDPSD